MELEKAPCQRCNGSNWNIFVVTLSEDLSLEAVKIFRKAPEELQKFYEKYGGDGATKPDEILIYPHSWGIIQCLECRGYFHRLEGGDCINCGRKAIVPNKPVLAPHGPIPERFEKVLNAMKKYGAPVLRAYDREDAFVALEGSQRIAAAWQLKLKPKLILLPADGSMIWTDWLDCSLPVLKYIENVKGNYFKNDFYSF